MDNMPGSAAGSPLPAILPAFCRGRRIHLSELVQQFRTGRWGLRYPITWKRKSHLRSGDKRVTAALRNRRPSVSTSYLKAVLFLRSQHGWTPCFRDSEMFSGARLCVTP